MKNPAGRALPAQPCCPSTSLPPPQQQLGAFSSSKTPPSTLVRPGVKPIATSSTPPLAWGSNRFMCLHAAGQLLLTGPVHFKLKDNLRSTSLPRRPSTVATSPEAASLPGSCSKLGLRFAVQQLSRVRLSLPFCSWGRRGERIHFSGSWEMLLIVPETGEVEGVPFPGLTSAQIHAEVTPEGGSPPVPDKPCTRRAEVKIIEAGLSQVIGRDSDWAHPGARGQGSDWAAGMRAGGCGKEGIHIKGLGFFPEEPLP